ncbi:sensor histidine kinase [Brachymonas denitrificans]|uniref:sensor histidine kinase n=1 Tax=Brachymonas denitrificans TaxID=28220 RepID=UPI0032201501
MGIFRREQRSLFGEILDWMLTPLLLLWPISLALTWLVAQGIANRPFDRALVYNAQALAQLVQLRDGRIQLSLPQQASEMLRADDTDQVFFQVLGPRGELLGGERLFPANRIDYEVPGEQGYVLRDDVLRTAQGQTLDVRVVMLRVLAGEYTLGPYATPGERADRTVTIQVAETREKRSVLATEIIKGVMLPQFIILPITVLLIWLALARGIRPLNDLEERIRARNPDDLSPLDQMAVPMEVSPLVGSVNEMMERQKQVAENQKRFLADAAHQLKTPLAGLRMQADLAQRTDASAEDLKRSLQQIGLSSVRATHSVNQLLAMARAEGGSMVREYCNVPRLVQEVVQDCFPRALAKRVDLGYEGAYPQDDGVWVEGNPILLQEMVRNLVDNAINYTPSSQDGMPAMVTVRVLVDAYGQVLIVQVEDNGPGIAASEREQVFKPFYRTLGTDADGSGLGLPIVQEIARRHDAVITLEDAQPRARRKGALFSVRFHSVAPPEDSQTAAAL